MNLNLYEDHLSLFTDLNVYCKKKTNAETVRTSFQRMVKLYVMRNLAKKLPDSSIRGGYYARPRHIFEELEIIKDKDKDKDLRFYPFFITYDLESLLLTDNLPNPRPVRAGLENIDQSHFLCVLMYPVIRTPSVKMIQMFLI